MAKKATVIVPTTGDRGPLLPVSVGSILSQSEPDIEILVVGDGLTDDSREIARGLQDLDPRVRFFDFPKHPRRGEENRHAVLSEADGEIVCYLCDRDFMLPNHVSTMLALLENADLAHTLRATFTENGIAFTSTVDITSKDDLSAIRSHRTTPAIPLSHAGHRMDFYRRLPFGWRTTPQYLYTDLHMWQQFLDQPECRTAMSPELTVLHIKRGDHPGWPTDLRLAVLEQWAATVARPGAIEDLTRSVNRALISDHATLSRRLRPRTKQWIRKVLLDNPALFDRFLSTRGPLKTARKIAWKLYGRKP